MKIKDLYMAHKFLLGFAVVLCVVTSVLDIVRIYTFTYILQYVFEGRLQDALQMMVWCVVVNLIVTLGRCWYNLRSNKLNQAAMLDYRGHMVQLMENSTKKLDQTYYINALNNDSKQIERGLKDQFKIIEGVVLSSVALIGLAYMNWMVAISSVVTFVLFILASQGIQGVAAKAEMERSEVNASFLKRSSDLIRGFGVWNAYNRKEEFAKELEADSLSFEEKNRVIENKVALVQETSAGFYFLYGILSRVVSFVLVIYKLCTPGLLVSEGQFSSYIGGGIYQVFECLGSVAGANELLSQRCAEIVEEDTNVETLDRFDLVVDNLTFGYEEQPVLENCSYTFEEGKKYMIIGGSGSGKSTLLKLLSKELEGQEGSITLGGKSYAELNPASVHTYVGYVDQSPYIFNDTVLANITLHGNVEESRLESAIERSKVKDFMDDLNQVIELNGENLSGGQKQRLSIARELVSEHKIILFDEVNSSLDKELNVALVETLVKLNETVLFVAHNYDAYTSSLFDEVIDLKTIQA